MEEKRENDSSPFVSEGSLQSIKFGIATMEEVRGYSVSDSPISHPSQLSNPFLGLPLASGKCESCGSTEIEKCEGHFGYIDLPVPIYHPSHVNELKHILSLVCLKCMRMKNVKVKHNLGKEVVSNMPCKYCQGLPPISVKEVKTTDGALCLELRVPARTRLREGFWNFLNKFGFRHDDTICRPLLPEEALKILEEIPLETKKRLASKGYFPQSGFILQCLPVPPNCLCIPDISDGQSIMSLDISTSMLKRVLNKTEVIRRSRSGEPNFASHEAEAIDLQSSIAQYMLLRGTTKVPQDTIRKYAVGTEASVCSAKKWLDKMKTLFISKGSGFSSRSVITGDAYIGIDVIGLPSEIAERISFEERVTPYNIKCLQKMVDERLCTTYKDRSTTYTISKGSKGHTFLSVGQVIQRQIMTGDIVFINRPPSTHKHSLQAFTVYLHDDHTVKMNPLICASFGADFDGDCVHIFYPQSLAAKAEVRELLSVEKQLLSSHNGNVHLQLVHDSLLAMKLSLNRFLLKKSTAQQLSMYVSPNLQPPAVIKSGSSGPLWSILQIMQAALPDQIDSFGQNHLIRLSEFLKLEFNRDLLQSSLTEIITSIFLTEGPNKALKFLSTLQPLLMEILFLEGFSITLKDFNIPRAEIDEIHHHIQKLSPILHQLRSTSDDLVQMQLESHLRCIKRPIETFILSLSAMGYLVDSRSDSAINKIVQQVGFLGRELYDTGKLYSRALVDEIFSHIENKGSPNGDHPSEAYGLIKNSFFHGLNPHEMLVHSLSAREVIVRSSRGLTEPGTLFKNLMAILRDVVICYDGTVRNVCSNSIVQFEYGMDGEGRSLAGEPVGVLAATAISTPAYKAVLDSSQSTNSSWELMKEILLCKVNYKNDGIDRRVILYLNECCCGRNFCKENSAVSVQGCLKRVRLQDCATDFFIEYQKHVVRPNISESASGLVGHIHLDRKRLEEFKRSTEDMLQACQGILFKYTKKKGQLSHFLKKIYLSVSECSYQSPCLQFSYCDVIEPLERTIDIMANSVCPILLDTIVKGDPRVHSANIVWLGSDATSWVSNPCKILKGELAVEVIIKKDRVKQNGDAWTIALDACIPVSHLIDTTRSIPYGIQQIQELLGISCAFDQSVQRLSKSIRMVAKGVLKEHLILIGNMMACTGKLIGFNTAGFRTLFRSLKVQVPFTESTLFRPIKSFERAGEKCQTDSLTSIVSSSSWGKQVAVGTGTHFDILWDKNQMANDRYIKKDVYDFIELVSTQDTRREASSVYLGVNVDNLAEEDDNYEMCPSPLLDAAFEQLTFDDNSEGEWNSQSKELQNVETGNSSWENVATVEVRSDNWQGWGKGSQPHRDSAPSQNANAHLWSTSDANTAQQQPTGSWDKLETHKNPSADGWGNFKPNKEKHCEPQDMLDQPRRSTIWNKNVTSIPETRPLDKPLNLRSEIWGSHTSEQEMNKSGRDGAQDGWGQEKKMSTNHGWDTSAGDCDMNFEGTSSMPKTNVWGVHSSKSANAESSSDVDGWNTNRETNSGSHAWRSQGWGSSRSVGNRSHSSNPGRSRGRGGRNSHGNFSSRAELLNSFTPEEEKIRADVTLVMQPIRRMLHDSSAGDKLSAEDGKLIMEKVFQYHPDREGKVTDQVDYVMVDKHEKYGLTKCFHVVTCNGSRTDFSYLKCLKNYVKQKYPTEADSFNKKFFDRPRQE